MSLIIDLYVEEDKSYLKFGLPKSTQSQGVTSTDWGHKILFIGTYMSTKKKKSKQ